MHYYNFLMKITRYMRNERFTIYLTLLTQITLICIDKAR